MIIRYNLKRNLTKLINLALGETKTDQNRAAYPVNDKYVL